MNIQGKELKPRALTWTERDALIKAGLDFVYCPVDVDDQVASIVRSRDIMRFILTDVYELTDEQLNTVSDKDAMNFAGEVITLTYQLQEETEKNEKRRGGGCPRIGRSTARDVRNYKPLQSSPSTAPSVTLTHHAYYSVQNWL